MKKKLVTALVLASLFSGVSAVYADYTDQEIDTKVNEIKEEFNGKYNALDGKVNNLTQGVEGNTKRIEKIEEKQKADDERIGNLEAEDGEIKKTIGTISDDLNAEKKARGEQEKTLSNNIEGVRHALDIERQNREGEDTKIRGEFAEADKKLDKKITDEETARKDEDTKIHGEFAEADKKLDKRITDEETARKDEDTKIRGEFAEADKKLDEKITAEATARKAEDAKIRSEFAAADQVLGQRIDKLATDTDKGLAKVSALAGLHPLDYDPANKLNLAVAGGFYNGKNAVALGAFYRPNRNIMLSFGSSIAGGENAYNVGLSVKVGKGGDRINQNNTTVSELYDLVGRLQEQVAEQQKKIEELQAK